MKRNKAEGYFEVESSLLDKDNYVVDQISKDERLMKLAEIMIMVLLFKQSNERYEATITYDSIAKKLNLSRRHVINSMDNLVESGYVTKNQEAKTNTYIINVERLNQGKDWN